jgi:hypothetical protein
MVVVVIALTAAKQSTYCTNHLACPLSPSLLGVPANTATELVPAFSSFPPAIFAFDDHDKYLFFFLLSSQKSKNRRRESNKLSLSVLWDSDRCFPPPFQSRETVRGRVTVLLIFLFASFILYRLSFSFFPFCFCFSVRGLPTVISRGASPFPSPAKYRFRSLCNPEPSFFSRPSLSPPPFYSPLPKDRVSYSCP